MVRLVAACVALAAAACGGGDKDGDGAAKQSNSAGKTSATSAARAQCPLTAEKVSEVLGTTVEKDAGSCSFYPTADSHTPNAQYNKQYQLACDKPGDVGYTESLEGLGVDAFIQPETAVGTMVLVCANPPFEITVDRGADHAGAKTAATALAKAVLES